MKLRFNSNYVSINKFNDVQINDFAILTGLNGAGKTHFLKAIERGHILIDDLSWSGIIYYNYDDFKINTVRTLGAPDARTSQYNQQINDLMQRLNTLRDRFINTNSGYRNSLEQSMVQIFVNNATFVGVSENDKRLFDDVIKQPLTQEFFSTELYQTASTFMQNLLSQAIYSGYSLVDVNLEDIETLIYSTREQITNELDNDYPIIKRMLEESNRSIFSLNQQDFENPDLLLDEIGNEEKAYQVQLAHNKFERFNALEYKEDRFYYEHKDFITAFGINPVDRINEVLKAYDCNGYQLVADQIRVNLGESPNATPINIRLKHSIENYETTFDQLSSGEQTLIALSLLIFKSQRKIAPAALLLDEIDSSLHPSMIRRLLEVIETIFVKKLGLKVILVTHSPSTVALAPDDSIYILNKEGLEKITKMDKGKAIGILSEGFAAFTQQESSLGIAYQIEQTNLPILFTEGITDKIILETAWKKLYSNKSQPFYIQDSFDAAFIANLFRRGQDVQDGIFHNYSDRLFIGLLDFDGKGFQEWNGTWAKNHILYEQDPRKSLTKKSLDVNGYLMLLPVPEEPMIQALAMTSDGKIFNDKSLLTIEHLFFGKKIFEDCFMTDSVPGGGYSIRLIKNKRTFATSLKEAPEEAFQNFISLFSTIERIIYDFNKS